MGGVNVGTVAKVRYSEDPKDPHVYVTLEVVRDQAERIRQPVIDENTKVVIHKGTVASIVNKGLLGDKMIDLSLAEPGTPRLDPGTPLATAEPLDLSTYVAKIDDLSQRRRNNVLTNLLQEANRRLLRTRSSRRTSREPSARCMISSTASPTKTASPTASSSTKPKPIASTASSGTSRARPSSSTRCSSTCTTSPTTIQKGPGLAHAVIYDGDMSANAAGSLDEVHKDLEHIRTGNGLVHGLIYGDSNTQHLMTNVDAMSDDLRAIVSNIRGGKGTLGALLVDPSIYEDLKSLPRQHRAAQPGPPRARALLDQARRLPGPSEDAPQGERRKTLRSLRLSLSVWTRQSRAV